MLKAFKAIETVVVLHLDAFYRDACIKFTFPMTSGRFFISKDKYYRLGD